MGGDAEIRAWERGFSTVDGYVCADCVDDRALQELIQATAEECSCDFCGRTDPEPIAALADVVVDHIADSIRTEYNRANGELGWIDGEYVGVAFDMSQLLDDELDAPLGHGAFANAVKGAATDDWWCERDYYGMRPHEELHYDWQLFVETIKHESRFLLLRPQSTDPDEEIVVGHPVRRGGAILAEIAKLIERNGLLRHLDAATRLFRCRVSADGTSYDTPQQLGPPPSDLATANRMSPAGIPMFYGAFNARTAIAETAGSGNTTASVGTFVTDRVCTVVDLGELPEIPSIFDEPDRPLRSPLLFLHGFRRDLLRPIARDGREHVEYVPTQVVTEYLRLAYRLPEDGEARLDGLIFTSTRDGGRNIVLFAGPDACVPAKSRGPERADALHLELETVAVYRLDWTFRATRRRGT